METYAFLVEGDRELEGEIENFGSKNSAQPLLYGSLLCDEELILQNVPNIIDIKTSIKLLQGLGVNIKKKDKEIQINPKSINKIKIDPKFANKTRGTVLLPSVLLKYQDEVKIPNPGGDNIGERKLDAHLFALKKLGAKISLHDDGIIVSKKILKGANINLPFPSVTGTISTIFAATYALGTTIIRNAAKEPEVCDIVRCLNKQGAKISGIGSDEIKIIGNSPLKFHRYNVIPDRIAACTFICLSAMSRSNIKIINIIPEHIKNPLNLFKSIGLKYEIDGTNINIMGKESKINPFQIQTGTYPMFPTDLQPIITSLGCIANGKSIIKENLYKSRLNHIRELRKLCANIHVENNSIITNNSKLRGSECYASDIRSGAAVLLASLVARGSSKIHNANQIDRGYEEIDKAINKIGGKIDRIKE